MTMKSHLTIISLARLGNSHQGSPSGALRAAWTAAPARAAALLPSRRFAMFISSTFFAVAIGLPAWAAELAPKGAYVTTEISCAQFNAGDGNSMSLIEIDGMRFSSGKAYCDMRPTAKAGVYHATCRSFPLPGETASTNDMIEFEGEKTFRLVAPDTIETDGNGQFKFCEIKP